MGLDLKISMPVGVETPNPDGDSYWPVQMADIEHDENKPEEYVVMGVYVKENRIRLRIKKDDIFTLANLLCKYP